MSGATDVAALRQVRLLAALLDHDTPPWRRGELPPLGHWLLFPPAVRQSTLGADGHPAREEDGLPRRMWAGSRVRFNRPIPIGAEVEQVIEQVSEIEKTGRSGRMRFVTLRKRILLGHDIAIEEEQDIVYREAAAPSGNAQPPAPATPRPHPPIARTLIANATALFRFSALTFNSHRIHYDRDYATQHEGYPALVVQGPFLATLLMDHFLRRRHDARVTGFAFRAMRPVFVDEPFTLGLTERDTGGDLVVIDSAGGLAMQAQVKT